MFVMYAPRLSGPNPPSLNHLVGYARRGINPSRMTRLSQLKYTSNRGHFAIGMSAESTALPIAAPRGFNWDRRSHAIAGYRRPTRRAFAKKAGYKLFGVWKEPAAGEGQSYREISQRLGLSKNTVLDIVKRERAA